MDPNANTGASGATDTSSVTAIKVQVVIDTTTEQLKKQFSGIQTDIEKDPIGLTFGVDKKTSKDAIVKGLQDILGKGTNITIGAGVDSNASNQVKKQVQNVANAGQQAANKNKVEVKVDTKTEDAKRKLDAFYSRVKEQGTLQKASLELDFSKKNESELKWLQKQLDDVGNEAEKLKTELGDLIPQGDYTKLSELERSVKNSTDRIKAHIQGLKDSTISEINNGLSQAYTKYGKAQSVGGNSQDYSPFINVDTSAFNKVKGEYDALNDSLTKSISKMKYVDAVTDETKQTIESMTNSGIEGVRKYGEALKFAYDLAQTNTTIETGVSFIDKLSEPGKLINLLKDHPEYEDIYRGMSSNYEGLFNYSKTLDISAATWKDFNKLVAVVNADNIANEKLNEVQQEASALHSQIAATIPSEIKTYDDLTQAVKAYYASVDVDKLAGTYNAGKIFDRIAPYTLFDNAPKSTTRSFDRLAWMNGSEENIRDMTNLLAGLRNIDIPQPENIVEPTEIQKSLQLVQDGLNKLSQLTKGTKEYDTALADVTQKWQESVALMKAADEAEKSLNAETKKRESAQAKYGISQFNDEMTKYGKLSMDQLALSYKNGGSSKELTAVDGLANESRENIEALKDYLADLLPQDRLDAVIQRYDNFERELSDKLYRVKQHYEDLKVARESTKATAEEKQQAKQTDTYTDNLATARNKYKNMSGLPTDVSGTLDNVQAQIDRLNTLKVGTEDYANQLKVIGTAWTDATRQMDAFDKAQKETENHVKSMTEQALAWQKSIKGDTEEADNLRKSVQRVLSIEKTLNADHSSDRYARGVAAMDDAFVDAKASMSAYKSEYKNLESQATSTLTKIRKAEMQLAEANNTTFDNLLKGQPGYIGDQDGSFEGRIRKLNEMDSQSEKYRTTLKGIQDDWQKISLKIQQALKSEEDLAKETTQRQNQIRSQQKAYNGIMKTLGTADFTDKDSKTKAFFEKNVNNDTKRTGAQAVAELQSEMAKLSETQPPSEYEQTLKNIKDLVVEINKQINEARNASSNVRSENTKSNHMQDLLRELYSYREKLVGLEGNQKLSEEYEKLFNAIEKGSYSFDEAQLKVSTFKNACHQAGLETETLGQKLSRLFKEHFQTAIAMAGVAMVKQGLREVYNNVVDIDSAMTNLKKVTNETESTYSSFLSSASSQARELGASISDVIDSTAEWSRLGYTLDESQELAKWSTVLSNIGDGIDSTSDAASYLVSILKGFGMEADEVEHVVNVLNSVGNNEPISESGIAEALVRSASALSAAGNSFEESVSLISAANSVLQDPDTVGKVYADVA